MSGGNDFACSQVVVFKIDALSSHLGSPLEQSLLLLSENHANPSRWQQFHLKTDGTSPVCYFPGANLEPEAHLERFCREVKAAGGGHGQEAPGTLAGDGPSSGMRKICVQTCYQLLCVGMKSVKAKRLLRSEWGGKVGACGVVWRADGWPGLCWCL